MPKHLAIGLLLLAAACSSPRETPREARTAPPPAPPAQTGSPTMEPLAEVRRPGGRAATALAAEAGCTPANEPVAHLTWRPARTIGRAQRVAVTPFANGFETGQYEVSRRLGARVRAFDWTEVSQNASYSWRVLTHHGTWVPSRTGGFVTPSCGVEDYG